MSKTRKAICLLPIGLLCAVFIYPFLHELGHGLVVFLLGAKVVKLQWFPLPSICTTCIKEFHRRYAKIVADIKEF